MKKKKIHDGRALLNFLNAAAHAKNVFSSKNSWLSGWMLKWSAINPKTSSVSSSEQKKKDLSSLLNAADSMRSSFSLGKEKIEDNESPNQTAVV